MADQDGKNQSETFKKGIEVRGEVLGRQYSSIRMTIFNNRYADLGLLSALKSWPELALHTKGALRNGLTVVEIREAILQNMVYLGAPIGIEAMRVTDKAIQEYKIEEKYRKPEPPTEE
ncbi:AhpD-like protein [Xylariomycetidae sp. FL2044]|nr:AhpD-like protein [Xylariomycetidae sp. FL2044]